MDINKITHSKLCGTRVTSLKRIANSTTSQNSIINNIELNDPLFLMNQSCQFMSLFINL